MSEDVTIRMMGEFSISVNGKEVTNLASRTKKGVSLMTYLVLNAGKQVPRQRLKNMLWSDYLHANPDGAMKTLISRLRKHLMATERVSLSCNNIFFGNIAINYFT